MRSSCTQHSTSTSGSNRRVPPPRGSSSPAPLGHPLLPPLAVWRGVSSCRGAPPAEPRLLWVRSPFFWSYVFFLESSMRVQVPVRGRSDVFSRPRLPTSPRIALHISSLLLACSAEPFFYRGSRTSFPGRDCVPLPVHCWIALSFHLLPNQVVRAWPWKSTVFGVAGLVTHFEAREVVQWLLETCQESRTGWCCVVSTHLNP